MEADSPTTLVSAKAAPSASALSTDSATAATASFKTPTQTTHDPEVVLPAHSSTTDRRLTHSSR